MSIAIGILSFICAILLMGYHDPLIDMVPSPHDGLAFILLMLLVIILFFIGIAGIEEDLP